VPGTVRPDRHYPDDLLEYDYWWVCFDGNRFVHVERKKPIG
jgi:hypothetical protein